MHALPKRFGATQPLCPQAPTRRERRYIPVTAPTTIIQIQATAIIGGVSTPKPQVHTQKALLHLFGAARTALLASTATSPRSFLPIHNRLYKRQERLTICGPISAMSTNSRIALERAKISTHPNNSLVSARPPLARLLLNLVYN